MERLNVEKSDCVEMGEPFIYKGYEVTVVKKDENDLTPAWNDLDMRTGKRIILVVEGIPKKFLEPILEHEVYEIENNFNHQRALMAGREKAEKLGILDEFTLFEKEWEDAKNQSKE